MILAQHLPMNDLFRFFLKELLDFFFLIFTPRITQHLTFCINVRRQREKIVTLRYYVNRKKLL